MTPKEIQENLDKLNELGKMKVTTTPEPTGVKEDSDVVTSEVINEVPVTPTPEPDVEIQNDTRNDDTAITTVTTVTPAPIFDDVAPDTDTIPTDSGSGAMENIDPDSV